jgi:hypothetical protein
MSRGSKSRKGGRTRVSFRPKYNGREEVPVLKILWAEADGRGYGSGKMVIDILTSPIRLILPWNPAGGRWEWLQSLKCRKDCAMALRKIDQSFDAAKAQSTTVADAGSYPQIIEHLACAVYPDGSKRQTSSLVVLCDGQGWRVCLSDRDNGRVMWKAGPTLSEALEAIELALLGDDPADWRRAADTKPARRK